MSEMNENKVQAESITIRVKLFAHYRNGRFVTAMKQYPLGTKIVDVVHILQIPPEDLGIVLCNGRTANLDHQLEDGEDLALFPLVGGG